MAKEALLQVRLDPELKKKAELLYESMGMSLSEAVRVFLAKSVTDQRLPFTPSAKCPRGELKAFGALNIFASPSKREQECAAWISSLDEYGNR